MYESFDNNKNKLQKVWEKTQDNTSQIRNEIKVVETPFLSQTNLKYVNIVTLYENVIFDPNIQYSVFLPNFPDWAVAFTRPSIVYRTPSAYDITKEVTSFFQEFGQGNLVDGMLMTTSINSRTWWTKVSGGWNFTIRPDVVVQQAQDVTESSFSGVALDLRFDVKLYIINERMYHAIQSGK